MNIDLCKSTLFFGWLPLLGVRVLFAHRSPSRRGNISFPTLFNKWPDRIWQPLWALVAPWRKSVTLRNPRLKPSKITLDISSMFDLYHIASFLCEVLHVKGLQKLLIKLKFNDRFSFSSKFDYFGFRPFRLTFGHQSSICRPPFSTSFTSEGTPCRQYTCQMSIAPAIKGNLNTLRPRMICHFYFKKEVSFH